MIGGEQAEAQPKRRDRKCAEQHDAVLLLERDHALHVGEHTDRPREHAEPGGHEGAAARCRALLLPGAGTQPEGQQGGQLE